MVSEEVYFGTAYRLGGKMLVDKKNDII